MLERYMTDRRKKLYKADNNMKLEYMYIKPMQRKLRNLEKGRIIFLNGVTSSGKTSIVEAMQSYSNPFFYVVANDLFENTIGDKHLQTDYWKYLSEVIIIMYHTAKLFSDSGKHVIIDGILVERSELKPHYDKVKEIFNGYPLEIVEVYCPLDLCRKRNIDRGDRREEQSDEQNKKRMINNRKLIATHRGASDNNMIHFVATATRSARGVSWRQIQVVASIPLR